MEVISANAFTGLHAQLLPQKANSEDSVIVVGEGRTQTRLENASAIYAFQTIMAGNSTFSFNLNSGTSVTYTPFPSTGNGQIETLSCVGTITATTADLGVVVTAAGLTGSPKTITVSVLKDDTAETWAGKIRTALNADLDLTTMFTVGPSTTPSSNVSLTRQPLKSYITPAGTLNVFADDDATLNIALNAGASGATTVTTSTNVFSGNDTVGVFPYYANGEDFEGLTFPTDLNVTAYMVRVADGLVTENIGGQTRDLPPGTHSLMFSTIGAGVFGSSTTITFSTNQQFCEIVVTAVLQE
jgi:hypothetical protein